MKKDKGNLKGSELLENENKNLILISIFSCINFHLVRKYFLIFNIYNYVNEN